MSKEQTRKKHEKEQREAQKQMEQQAKALRKHQRQRKQALKSLTELCREAQTEVNRFIRARDAEKGCISCGSPDVDDAGHFIHAGSKYRTSRLRFDERVIHGQCARCNRFAGGGNNAEFREGLIARYGQEYVDEIDELKRKADSGELEPLTKDEAREIKRAYAKKTREMQK